MSRKKPEHLRKPPRAATHLRPATRRWRASAWNSKTGQLWLRMDGVWLAYHTLHSVDPFELAGSVVIGNFTLKGDVQWLN